MYLFHSRFQASVERYPYLSTGEEPDSSVGIECCVSVVMPYILTDRHLSMLTYASTTACTQTYIERENKP